MIRILLADDHDLMREGIRSMLESHSNFEVCAEAKDGIEAAEKALEYRPDVVILDVTMPKMNGLEASRRITKQLPETQVLIFTIHDSEDMVRETLDAGAHGYVLKSEAPTHLAAAVEAVAQRDLYFSSGISNFVIDSLVNSGGGTIEGSIQEIPLTAREIEVLKLLARGNAEIGEGVLNVDEALRTDDGHALVDVERGAQRRVDALGDHRRLVHVGHAVEQHGELVAAEAGDRVRRADR